jgi:putative DNA primase/helicase
MNNSSTYHPDRAEVDALAQGRWDYILSALAPEHLRPAIENPKVRVACPGPDHVSVNGDAFGVFKDVAITGGGFCNTCGGFGSGYSLLMWIYGWTFDEVLRNVWDLMDGKPPKDIPKICKADPQPKKCSPEENSKRQKKLRSLWSASIGLGHVKAAPVRKYLRNRGLIPVRGPLKALRFHPAVPAVTKKGKYAGKHMAILAMAQKADASGGMHRITVHRTFLTTEGQKQTLDGKMVARQMMPYPDTRSVCGAGVYLDEPDAIGTVLHIAEGIETALAVRMLTNEPTVATLNTTLMAQFIPPKGVRCVVIWADQDPNGAGLTAAKKAAANLREMGLRALIVLPPVSDRTKADWNDMVAARGVESLRAMPFYRSVTRTVQEFLQTPADVVINQ